MMENKEAIIKEAEESVLHTYNRYQVVLDHGDGVYLYDTDGKKYLDFAAGIAVQALGYHYPGYDEALKAQIDKLMHTSNLYYNEPAAEAADKLVRMSDMSRVFFTNSGTEAIEGAIKAARKYAWLKDGKQDHEIIAMNHSFHGRSMGALSVTGNEKYQAPFRPLIGGIRFADYNDLESVKAQFNEHTCAVILETIQGEGGIYPATEEFLKGVKALCEEHDALLILDEIRKDVIEAAKEKCPKLKYILSMQKEANEGNILSLTKSMMEQTIDEDTGAEKTDITPEQLCTIMFTSGTTGKSKGVMLTHRNLVENATCLDMKLPERNVLLSVLPIHHAYCLSMDILKGISLGAIICINDSLMRVAKNIKLFKPNMILMVPLMIETFAKKLEDVKDLPEKVVKEAVFGSQFHTICSGGAYLNPEYIELFERFGIQILQGYGMTECSPVISTNVAWNVKKNSVGQLLPNCEAKTVDGELWVRGSSVMQGYYKMPEETKTALKDGWLCTGDLGYVDEDRFIYLTGRKKNLIITKNGENVSPEEVENKLSSSRLVQEVVVREAKGVIEAEIYPDEEYAKKQGLEREEEVRAELQKLIDEYNQGAPAYKKIYSLIIREKEFEKTASRKIKRY